MVSDSPPDPPACCQMRRPGFCPCHRRCLCFKNSCGATTIFFFFFSSFSLLAAFPYARYTLTSPFFGCRFSPLHHPRLLDQNGPTPSSPGQVRDLLYSRPVYTYVPVGSACTSSHTNLFNCMHRPCLLADSRKPSFPCHRCISSPCPPLLNHLEMSPCTPSPQFALYCHQCYI